MATCSDRACQIAGALTWKRAPHASGLRAMGVTEELVPKIFAGALADHTHKTNPREASVGDYERMLTESM